MKRVLFALLLLAAPAFALEPPPPPTDLEILSARAQADEAQVAYLGKLVTRLQAELKTAQDAAPKPTESK